jgi:hypothetical protein
MYSKDRTLLDRREMLRVKVKSLADEARIIRREERKTFGTLREELYRHRMDVVRYEARHAHLAYGFIRGLTYEQMESSTNQSPNWERVRQLIKKYGPKNFAEPSVMQKPVAVIKHAAPRVKRHRPQGESALA